MPFDERHQYLQGLARGRKARGIDHEHVMRARFQQPADHAELHSRRIDRVEPDQVFPVELVFFRRWQVVAQQADLDAICLRGLVTIADPVQLCDQSAAVTLRLEYVHFAPFGLRQWRTHRSREPCRCSGPASTRPLHHGTSAACPRCRTDRRWTTDPPAFVVQQRVGIARVGLDANPTLDAEWRTDTPHHHPTVRRSSGRSFRGGRLSWRLALRHWLRRLH